MNIFFITVIIFIIVYLLLTWFAKTSAKRISKIIRFIESKSPNKFKPPSSAEPSKNEVAFLRKQEKNTDEKQRLNIKISKII